MSVACAQMVAMMDILGSVVFTPAERVFTARTALILVPLLVKLVETQMGCVLVNQDGWEQTVQQNVFTPMERTAATYAVYSVLTRHVIDSMEDVYLVV